MADEKEKKTTEKTEATPSKDGKAPEEAAEKAEVKTDTGDTPKANTSENHAAVDTEKDAAATDASATPPAPAEKPKKSLFPWKNKRDVTKNPTKVTTLTPTEALAKTLDDHISEIKGDDYFVLRVKKRTLLILLGFGVLLMWVFPLGQLALQNSQQPAQSNTTTVEENSPSPTPAPETLKIRVRHLPTQQDTAQAIGDLFANQGYITVEYQEDKQITFSGVVVVTKRDKPDIKASLESLLTKESFPVASQSAELTQDSDFDATIFVGKITQ